MKGVPGGLRNCSLLMRVECVRAGVDERFQFGLDLDILWRTLVVGQLFPEEFLCISVLD
jgi:hypothetical protein